MRQKTQNNFLKLSIHLSVIKLKSKEMLQILYGKSKASHLRKFMHKSAPNIFLVQFFAFQFYLTIDIFSEQPFFRFSYKHCNFSHVFPLVKMAYYTHIYSMELTSQFFGAYDDNMSVAQNMSPWLAVLDGRQSVEWETKG